MVDAMGKMGCHPIFISAVGEDLSSTAIMSTLPPNATKYIQRLPKSSTSQCDIVFDAKGECQFLLGDMEIHKQITPNLVSSLTNNVKQHFPV